MRGLNRLSDRTVSSLKGPKIISDGGGLYLRALATGSKRWLFVYHAPKRVEITIGPYPGITLAEARKHRDAHRSKLDAGEDPKKSDEQVRKESVTFGKFALDLVASLEEGWRNPKHRQQWKNTLVTYCKPIWNKPPAEVSTADVMAIIGPLWNTKSETADRVRGRIERVLDAAKVNGHIAEDRANPARWKGHLAMILPPKQKLTRGHFDSMPHAEVPAFMAALRARSALAARALEVTILCALRTTSAIGGHVREVDLKEKVWTIPPERMKGKKGHRRELRVPLVGRALEIITERVAAADESGLLFPGEKPGRPISNMAMDMLLRRMGLAVTVHGYRSSFKDWASDETDFADEISEMALAHTVGSAVRQAYRRKDALEKRRALMTEWDGYLAGGAVAEAA